MTQVIFAISLSIRFFQFMSRQEKQAPALNTEDLTSSTRNLLLYYRILSAALAPLVNV